MRKKGDRIGRQRVHGPQEHNDERYGRRQTRKFLPEFRPQKRPTDDAEQGEAGEDVDRQVEPMIAFDRLATESVIQGEA